MCDKIKLVKEEKLTSYKQEKEKLSERRRILGLVAAGAVLATGALMAPSQSEAHHAVPEKAPDKQEQQVDMGGQSIEMESDTLELAKKFATERYSELGVESVKDFQTTANPEEYYNSPGSEEMIPRDKVAVKLHLEDNPELMRMVTHREDIDAKPSAVKAWLLAADPEHPGKLTPGLWVASNAEYGYDASQTPEEIKLFPKQDYPAGTRIAVGVVNEAKTDTTVGPTHKRLVEGTQLAGVIELMEDGKGNRVWREATEAPEVVPPELNITYNE